MCSPAVESQGLAASGETTCLFPWSAWLRHLHSQTLDQIKTKLLVLNRSMRSTAKSTAITDPDPSFNDSWSEVGWLGFLGRFLMRLLMRRVPLNNRMTCPANSRLFSTRHQFETQNWLWVVLFVFCMLFVTIIFCNKFRNMKVFKDLWDEDLCFSVVSQVTSWWFGNSILPAVPCSYHNLAYIFVYLV